MGKYQTLDQFLFNPFGMHNSNITKARELDVLYEKERDKIKLIAYTIVEDSYFFHVKIPSKSQKSDNVYHDVVIRFFTDNPELLKSTHIRDYYIQFFSNSPGFIYKYAVLYKKYDYLIEFLYDKLDPEYFDKLPKNIEKEMDLSFDKSIYYACRYLSERRFRVLNKVGIGIGRKLKPDVFFKGITDFKTVTLNTELRNLSKSSLKKLEKELKDHEEEKRKNDVHRKQPTKSSLSSHRVEKIVAKKSTSSHRSIVRKGARKSTKKS